MRGKKQKEIDTLRHTVDYWSGLVKGLLLKSEELLIQNGDLRIENAVLKERLRKNPPEDQEDLKTN